MRKGVTKMYTPFPRKKNVWAGAKFCVGTCKALRWHMQCFA